LWHKMGDDDMPVFDPNPKRQLKDGQPEAEAEDERIRELSSGEPADELAGLEYVERFESNHATTVVTFGYNLTTDFLPKSTTPVSPAITSALRALYRIEMQLRDQIRDLDAPIYPSEPTSFYRTIRANKADDSGAKYPVRAPEVAAASNWKVPNWCSPCPVRPTSRTPRRP
jgi:hypothetical protein